jgi:hypothetical protein
MHRTKQCVPSIIAVSFFPIVITCALLLSYTTAVAKMSVLSLQPPRQAAAGRPSPAFIRDFESRMRPFFESKLKGGRALLQLPQAQLPKEIDFLLLAKLWYGLSPEFKILYKTATQIPSGFQMYVSPGGHFEIYYLPVTLDDVNGVDITDTMHYGAAGDWRPRLPVPDGIPDYVNEVAWALDSTWSMEIDRFGFVAPLPYKDATHTSDRYRVVITWFYDGWYGMTYPEDMANGTPPGYTSYIELRNNWNGAPWTSLGYEAHPENGIRVTCAHEFFHGVQYAMTWSDTGWMDDFPLSWLEGTAVLMEELAFDYVNDYLQYTTSFFDDPMMSFLSTATDMSVYTNALLTKWLFEKATGSHRIDFVRQIFFTNYSKPTSFHPNLRATSLSFGSPWVTILNHFHTGSYFTGARADTSRFLADAALMGAWSYSHDSLSSSYPVTKTVNPYGMQIFSFGPDSANEDTADFQLRCETTNLDTVPYPSWAASCIVRRKTGPDTVMFLAVDIAGWASVRIPGWKSLNEILLVVSNGAPMEKRTATAYYLPRFPPLVIFPNPGHIRTKKFMHFEGNDIQEIRIYAGDGGLVSVSTDKSFQQYIHGFIWQFANHNGKTVVPGYYTAAVTMRSSPAAEKKTSLHKVLVFP